MKKRLYFAYGSNMNLKQMKRRCPRAKFVATGILKDYNIAFKGSDGFSYLTIEKEKGIDVPLAIWETTPKCEESLDRYEGYPRFYRKEEIKAFQYNPKTNSYDEIKGYIYIMNDWRGNYAKPSKGYYKICLEGLNHCGLKANLLNKALQKVGGYVEE